PSDLDLPVLHSFPTRRSSDLQASGGGMSKTASVTVTGGSTTPSGVSFNSTTGMFTIQANAGYNNTGEIQVISLNGIQYALVTLQDRKSTRLNSSHSQISYAVF